jgi:hypothetical protein
MIPRGTKVSKQLEFFRWEGRVCGEVTLLDNRRIIVVQQDHNHIFCAHEQDLTVMMETKEEV